MVLSSTYKLNTGEVISEVIDGEVIIINLKQGHYYSLREAGSDIWSGITQGLTGEEIIQSLQSVYEISFETAKPSVEGLLTQLLAESIVVRCETEGNFTPAGNVLKTGGISKVAKNFSPPALEKYTDMEELLLLDPIHDVDDQGWPKTPEVPGQ